MKRKRTVGKFTLEKNKSLKDTAGQFIRFFVLFQKYESAAFMQGTTATTTTTTKKNIFLAGMEVSLEIYFNLMLECVKHQNIRKNSWKKIKLKLLQWEWEAKENRTNLPSI